jgi:hypothetical protein
MSKKCKTLSANVKKDFMKEKEKMDRKLNGKSAKNNINNLEFELKEQVIKRFECLFGEFFASAFFLSHWVPLFTKGRKSSIRKRP